jgi:hypothetical protein
VVEFGLLLVDVIDVYLTTRAARASTEEGN